MSFKFPSMIISKFWNNLFRGVWFIIQNEAQEGEGESKGGELNWFDLSVKASVCGWSWSLAKSSKQRPINTHTHTYTIISFPGGASGKIKWPPHHAFGNVLKSFLICRKLKATVLITGLHLNLNRVYNSEWISQRRKNVQIIFKKKGCPFISKNRKINPILI